MFLLVFSIHGLIFKIFSHLLLLCFMTYDIFEFFFKFYFSRYKNVGIIFYSKKFKYIQFLTPIPKG